MPDPTTYRIDYTRDASDGAWVRAHTESLVNLGVLVPDDTLQAIADAWKEDLNGLRRDMDWPELTSLLDALGGTNE